MQQLKISSLLQGGRYKIEEVLGQGGFGITYLATQELLNRKVAIKEFFYKEYCERDEATSYVTLGTTSNRVLVERFMEKFIKEARTISTLNHPHIIRIYDIFKENNTAYYVMEYIEGESLAELVKQRGALPEDMAVGYIKQVASALEFVHQHSINHLDVKPANIMVRKEDNQAVLIDFGLSKQYDASGEQTSTTPVGISHGYAPMEQYNVGGVGTFSPQTDIYSLGATLYKLVTGNTPPQAIEIFNDGLPELSSNVSSHIREVIKKSMLPKKVERYNCIKDFVLQLDRKAKSILCDKEATVVIEESRIQKTVESVSAISGSKNTSKFLTPIICAIALIVGFVAFSMLGNNNEPIQENDSSMIAKDMYDKAMTYYSSNDYIKAIPLLEEAANMGDADAQTQLGYCYASGDGVNKDEKKAAELWRKAAEQGNADAQCNLAWCYINGRGVEKNIAIAFDWYSKSANQGHSGAQVSLGWCYEMGEGVTKDLSKAIEWYTKAAYQGNVMAQYNLGNCYYDGIGITKDLNKAFEWWQKAAIQENVNAQSMLGWCYKNGEGVTKNLEKAFEWYSKAAQQGEPNAQFHLGYCYYFGEGITRDFQKAFEYWLKAAEQNLVNAQYNVGYLYYSGGGVEKNNEKAKEWLEKAMEGGNEDAGKLLTQIKNEENIAQIKLNNKRGQNKKKVTITGYVGDLNGPLIGASVIEKGTNNGVISDYEGNFTITVASDAIIQVSYVGYKTREKKAEKYMAFMLSKK